jgi:hypothetical protein
LFVSLGNAFLLPDITIGQNINKPNLFVIISFKFFLMFPRSELSMFQ